MNHMCSSDALGQKLRELHALLQIVHRTLDSSDSSIFIAESIDLMSAACGMTHDCELLRQRMDAELYQQNSKYYAQ